MTIHKSYHEKNKGKYDTYNQITDLSKEQENITNTKLWLKLIDDSKRYKHWTLTNLLRHLLLYILYILYLQDHETFEGFLKNVKQPFIYTQIHYVELIKKCKNIFLVLLMGNSMATLLPTNYPMTLNRSLSRYIHSASIWAYDYTIHLKLYWPH